MTLYELISFGSLLILGGNAHCQNLPVTTYMRSAKARVSIQNGTSAGFWLGLLAHWKTGSLKRRLFAAQALSRSMGLAAPESHAPSETQMGMPSRCHPLRYLGPWRALRNQETATRQKRKDDTMSSSTTDKLKGRLKEAAGALTGDEDLKKEGQLDQATAKVKETVEKVIDKAKDLVGGQKKDDE